MGFYIYTDTVITDFGIGREQVKLAYESLMRALDSNELHRVKREDYQNASTLNELMLVCRWALNSNQDGDIVGLKYAGVKAAEEELIFATLAPFVSPGSFVQYEREGCLAKEKHRFEFNGGFMVEKLWHEELDNELNEYWSEIKR